MMKTAGGMLCALGMMVFSGCSLVITNNDVQGSAAKFTVKVNGHVIVEDLVIACGDKSDAIGLGLGGEVEITGSALDYDYTHTHILEADSISLPYWDWEWEGEAP